MKQITTTTLATIMMIVAGALNLFAQETATFTGTVLSYGSGRNIRTTQSTFTLHLNGVTSDADAQRLLGVLQDRGQDGLLEIIRNEELGRFSIGSRVGRPINAVRVTEADGLITIRAIFDRWVSIGEIRYGYRSVDYPFGYLEIIMDPKTGKGEGTYIAAAQVRFKTDKRTGKDTVSIESFATFPSRLMAVQMRGKRFY